MLDSKARIVHASSAPHPPSAALRKQTVQALRQCAEEAGAAQTASRAAQHAAIEEKKALAAELQSARDEVAAILGSSRSIQAQLGDAAGAMQVLQGKVDSMTAERDGLTARISRADTDLQVRIIRFGTVAS